MLIKHLIKVEEEKLSVLEKYYPVWTNERSSFQELLESYIKGIECIIYNGVEVNSHATDTCPFVIIGSQVELSDTYTHETENIQIVSPFTGEVNLDVVSASYLSPMGKAFLLKKVNDSVKVETPMGILNYKVENIILPDDTFQF
jgi:transcription elongation factor GreA